MRDHVLTQLQETGELVVANGARLSAVIAALEQLGIDPANVEIENADWGVKIVVVADA